MRPADLQISPLARAYLAAIRAGHITEDSPGLQLLDGAAYLLWRGIGGTSVEVLRAMAALCEVAAQLKEENSHAKDQVSVNANGSASESLQIRV